MAVIEHETRTSSAEGTVTMLHVVESTAVKRTVGDEPQPAELVKTDDELLADVLKHTRPLDDGHFVD
jgi:hypothetical protein